MILYAALGPEAAHATTWVDALVAFTGRGPVAVRVHHTLRLATLIRIAEVFGQATAHTDSIVYPALGIRATFPRVARILLLNNWGDSR